MGKGRSGRNLHYNSAGHYELLKKAMRIPMEVNQMLAKAIEMAKADLNNHIQRPGKDFTRKRVYNIDVLIAILIKMAGSTIDEEVRNAYPEICDILGLSEEDKKTTLAPTGAGFVQQRQKVFYTFFKKIFDYFTALTSAYIPKYRDYRLLAADGSDFCTPANPDEPDYYIEKSDGSSPYNLMHIDGLYDVLANTYVYISTNGKRKGDEKKIAIEMIKASEIIKAILMGDRGYESFHVMAHLRKKGWKYIIRGKDIDSNGIAAGLVLPDTPTFDVKINMHLTNKSSDAIKYLVEDHPNEYRIISGKNFDFLPDTSKKNDDPVFFYLPFRVVRLEVEPGKYEVLLTNLSQEEFPPDTLKELYHLRWNIETSYRFFKHTLETLCVHSKKAECIKQEIYCHATFYNFVRFFTNAVAQIDTKQDTKYKYVPSFSHAVGTCRRYLRGEITLFTAICYIDRDRVPIRHDRKYARRMKIRKPRCFAWRGH